MESILRFPECLPSGWRARLAFQADEPEFKSLERFLKKEYASGEEIYPPPDCVFKALQSVDFGDVRVIILGQDPYHGPGQAIGLSFGVPNGLRPKPPSLANLFKELQADVGSPSGPFNGSDLTGWAAQGVLLLNTVLTVRRGQAFSHRGKGWESFTDEVIRQLNEREMPVVFVLWGAHAIAKKKLISNARHLLLESAHPSPLSAFRGFFGSNPFSRVNAHLREIGSVEVDWLRISENDWSDKRP